MRVISGLAKGHRLKSPDGTDTRPTADRIKESLFSSISFKLPGAFFLDIFCGTGAIGIEALSRGSEHADFIDYSSDACKITEYNLIHTKLLNKARIINNDYLLALEFLAINKMKYDFVFVDPPYYNGMANKSINVIIENNLLNDGGYIIIEMASDEEIVNFDLKVGEKKEKKLFDSFIYIEKKYHTTKIITLKQITS